MTVGRPTLFVIFGGSGDLAWRKLVPSFFNLHLDGHLPREWTLVGLGRRSLGDREYRDRLREGVAENSRRGSPDAEAWQEFAARIFYMELDAGSADAYGPLARHLEELEGRWSEPANRIHYLAVPPGLVERIVAGLDEAGLAGPQDRTSVVVEKPFGHDLESALALDASIKKVFSEPQIYRIDHYLGKETVQNILAFRFANAIFEPIWDRRYIDHIQITMAESDGVGHRGNYYEGIGALRDMLQNHLLQVLSLVAMEPPTSFAAGSLRSRKVDVLQAIRPIPADRMSEFAVRGQYGPGWDRGQEVVGYRQEEGVTDGSETETYAALKLLIDNWRWQGVPFYLRTGKRLPAKVSEVNIFFRPVPHRLFPPSVDSDWSPDRLTLRLQPDESILLSFLAKRPGQNIRLSPVEMRFCYDEYFTETPPTAYETLLRDVTQGDPALFKRIDQVESSWRAVQPVLDTWRDSPPTSFPDYQAGSWGPDAADRLLARDGRSWAPPALDRRGGES